MVGSLSFKTRVCPLVNCIFLQFFSKKVLLLVRFLDDYTYMRAVICKLIVMFLLMGGQLSAESFAKANSLFNQGTPRSIKESLIILENLIADKKADGKVYALASLVYANYGFDDYKHIGPEAIDLLQVSKIYLQNAQKLGEKGSNVAKAEALLYMISGNFQRSEQLLKAAIKVNATDSELYYYLACSSEGKLHLPDTPAGGYAEKAIELNPANLMALEDMFLSAIQNDDLVRAEFFQKKLIETPGAKDRLSFYAGLMSLGKGQRTDAILSFQTFLRDNPADARGESLRRELPELKE